MSNTPFYIGSTSSDLVLDIQQSSGKEVPVGGIQQWKMKDEANQRWGLFPYGPVGAASATIYANPPPGAVPVVRSYFQIKSDETGSVLAASGGSGLQQVAQVVDQELASGGYGTPPPYPPATLEQLWTLVARPAGDIQIINASNGLAIDVEDNSMTPGGVIQLYKLIDEPNQGWTFEPATQGNTGNAKFPVAAPSIEFDTSPNPDGGSDVVVTGSGFAPAEQVVMSASNYPVNAGNIDETLKADAQGILTATISTNLPVSTLPVGQAETTWITVTVQLPNGGGVLALGLLSFIGFVGTNTP
jgi:ricin-type beta-trefoil lectin protein